MNQPTNQPSNQSKSVFQIILISFLTVLVLQAALLPAIFLGSGVINRLNRNAENILDQQTENRKNYLENSMVDNWSSLSILSDEINDAALRLKLHGKLDLSQLDSSSDACMPLLTEITHHLISTLYSKQVSGIFVIFNTHDPMEESDWFSRTGIYIRDQDPASTPSSRHGDLLIERAPIQLVQSLNLSADSGWQPMFSFSGHDQDGYLGSPIRAALQDRLQEHPSEYGYWTTSPYTLYGDNSPAISYSVPLVLDDGTVYGVLGVELLTSYLQSLLPYEELHDNRQGSYILGNFAASELDSDQIHFRPVVQSTGPFYTEDPDCRELVLNRTSSGYRLHTQGKDYFSALQPMELYNRNGPFTGNQWALISLVRDDHLYSFSRQMSTALVSSVILFVIIGLVSILIVSRRLSRPITRLYSQVISQKGNSSLPVFSSTGIREIDQFASAITDLSQKVLDTSTKFLRIIEMSSIEMGGYELRNNTGRVYVTDNFFELIGIRHVSPEDMTLNGFRRLLDSLDKRYENKVTPEGNKVYKIPLENGVRYLQIKEVWEEARQVGLAEDVTTSTLERIRIEHERDYDALTGLYNRRAFHRECRLLFQNPEKLKKAALLMMDLDNLKHVNDTFGHEWGDQYIGQAGHCLAEHTPERSIRARVSGDEFYLLLYGYDSKEEIRKDLSVLSEALQTHQIQLPSGRTLYLSASGGIAWYPDDHTELDMLIKYADFAMYQIKKSRKGAIGDFDLGVYNQASYEILIRQEFHQLLSHELITYHFQPIFSGRTGRAVAYEALMRVNLPTLRSPETVMKLARSENCLHEVERMTMFKATEAFQTLLEQNVLDPDCFLFINSIASESLTPQELQEYHERFASIQRRIVVEITEAEFMVPEALQMKKEAPGFSGMFALDDYGSGYNTEKNLLELAPRFIKVDISIIRDIDMDPDKQQILSNIVSYAHARDMYIVAEGLETPSEVMKVLELGADLLQGYFLARPAALPNMISKEAASLIQECK